MNDITADSDESVIHCRNCGSQLHGRYCHDCSQDCEEGNPGFREWLFETFAEFTSLESRSVLSVRKLLTRPGELTVAWKQGKRERYTRPLRLVVVSLVLLILVRSILGSGRGLLASVVLGFLEGAVGDGGEVEEAVVLQETARILRWFTLALVPILAAVISQFFRRRAFSEHLVFTLHVFSFALILRTLFSFFELVIVAEDITETVQSLAISVYAFMAMRRVYGESILKTAVKFLAIAILSVIIWATAGVAVVALNMYSV